MCLAVPMRIVGIDGAGGGAVDLEGERYPVDLTLIENPRLGDYVIVHAGFAIEKLDRREADERLLLFDRLADRYRRELGGDVVLIRRPEGGRGTP
ncbi:MAG: HypC/HybG/HupF family hydrogenase formation chaperone [Deltaproteobacteria bacterium]|nr:HypC/HybG/HupF family hydrogenase formation chaperone [Deltaproteobacteria bacterium]